MWKDYFDNTSILGDKSTVFIPFTLQIFIEPVRYKNKRREVEIWVNKYIHNLRYILKNDSNFNQHGLVKEIAYTTQFGQRSHRINITGFYKTNYTDFKNTTKQTDDTYLMSTMVDTGDSTQLVQGNIGGQVSHGQNVTTEWDAIVAQFITNLVNATAGTSTEITIDNIIKLDFGEVKYGLGYRTLPQ